MLRRPGDEPPPALGAAVTLPGPLSPVKGKARVPWGLSLLLLLAAGACAGPTIRPATPTGNGAIVQELPGLRVSVEAEAWQGRPRNLRTYVLPFLVTLQNVGADPVVIARSDFLLLDDANRQSLPLPPSEVVTLLGGRGSGIGVSPSVGVSGSSAGSTEVGVGLGIILGGSGIDPRDILTLALPEGPVQPGAEVRGFIYFPHPAQVYQALRVVVIPRALPGAPRLDFEFRRSKS